MRWRLLTNTSSELMRMRCVNQYLQRTEQADADGMPTHRSGIIHTYRSWY